MKHHYWAQVAPRIDFSQDIKIFKTWPQVRDIPLYIENDYFAPYYQEVSKYLESNPNWKVAFSEPERGHTGFSLKKASRQFEQGVTTSFRMKSLHHCLTYENIRNKSILDYNHIVEFGAGIGDTAHTIFDRGYKGKYTIVDLPQVGKLSSYYLDNRSVYVPDIRDVTDIDERTLFIATWSLSEIPYEYRYEIAKKIKGLDQLVVFQDQFYGINNFDFFVDAWANLTDCYFRMKTIYFHQVGTQGFSRYFIGAHNGTTTSDYTSN